jgi:reactive intermediate/imine deaminase
MATFSIRSTKRLGRESSASLTICSNSSFENHCFVTTFVANERIINYETTRTAVRPIVENQKRFRNLYNLKSECEMSHNAIATDRAPKAMGPYSQALRVADTIYVSGQLGVDPLTGTLVDGGIREQTHQTIANLVAIVETAGGSIGSIVRVTFFLANWDDFAIMNEVCAQMFAQPYPARSTIQNSRPMHALVGADAIAVVAS